MLPLRPARDDDSAAILALHADVFAEYDGCVMVESEYPELARPATSFAAMGGRFWVVEDEQGLAATVAVTPEHEPGVYELRKLYVARRARRCGLGAHLVAEVERHVRAEGGTEIHLFSDTRFVDAHRLYARLGYARLDGTRDLFDASHTVEYPFAKRLG